LSLTDAAARLQSPESTAYNWPVREGTIMVSQETLDQATRRLVAQFHPHKIVLFGSQARGTANAHSDVDLLIITRIDGDRRQLMLEMDRSLHGLNLPRDLVVLSPEEFDRDQKIPGTVARPALLEGRVLYDSAA
jgi:predicted nucleotidyltransferase